MQPDPDSITDGKLPACPQEDLDQLDTGKLIEQLVRDEDRVPRNVIDTCAARGNDTIAALRDRLDRDDAWIPGDLPEGEWWLRLHAAMILGLIADENAGLLLAQLLRRMADANEENLQEWFSGDWPALFANKPEGVLPALIAIYSDRTIDWYFRSDALDPVVAAAERRGGDALEAALETVARVATDETEDWDFRLVAGNLLLDFPRDRYRALLEDLAARQTGLGRFFSRDDIERSYAGLKDHPSWQRFKDPWKFYRPGAIAARQDRWAKEDAEADDDEYDEAMEEPGMPYVRAVPKVGRNDPCPCGSGRKYKKCCLVGDSA